MPRRRRTTSGADVVIDALFGTGFHGEPRPEAAGVIERINAAGAPVVAVDLPSGVNASTGEIEGAAVQADLTVTFHAAKVGLSSRPVASTQAVSSWRTSGSSRSRRRPSVRRPRSSISSRVEGRATRSTRPARSSSSAAPRG